MSDHDFRQWRLEREYDTRKGTHRLTNGRAQLSIWVGEVEDPDLEALEAQLERGRQHGGKP